MEGEKEQLARRERRCKNLIEREGGEMHACKTRILTLSKELGVTDQKDKTIFARRGKTSAPIGKGR